MKLLLVFAAIIVVAYAGHHGGYGHGHGGYGHGHGHGHHGWGRKYYGWANVNAWQTPWAYQYGLNEQGKGYNKWVWQGGNFHHTYPVHHKGWGWGGYQG